MSRPGDWYVLDLDEDPTPGDPYQVQQLARTFLALSADAFAAAADVRRLAGEQGVGDWVGKAGTAFNDAVAELPGQLDHLDASYGIAGQALKVYASDLETAQLQADAALARGRELWQAGLPADVATRVGADAAAPAEADRAALVEADLAAERRLALAARQLREQAARTCRDEIERASDAGIQNRSFWDRVTDFAGDVWDRAVAVAKVVAVVAGVAAFVVGGPLAWVAVAASLVVLADVLDRYADGDANLWDVGLALAQCIPGTTGLTTVAGLARGARWATTGLRGLVSGASGVSGATHHLTSLATVVRHSVSGGVSSGVSGGLRHELDGVVDVAFGARRTRIGADRETLAVASRVRPLDGYHDVVVHGTASTFEPLGPAFAVSPSQVADVIRANPDYVSGTPVRALSCWTGKNGVEGPAQQLANHLQAEVLAPTVKAGVPAGLGARDAVLGVGNRIVEPGTLVRLDNGEEVVAEWVRLTPESRPANQT